MILLLAHRKVIIRQAIKNVNGPLRLDSYVLKGSKDLNPSCVSRAQQLQR